MNWDCPDRASTNFTANTSAPVPKVRLRFGRPAFPEAIIIRPGRRRSWPCSKNSSPQNHLPPTAPAPANSTAASNLKPTAPASAAGPSKTNWPQIPAARPRPNPSNHLLDQLLLHVNQHEIHREPGTTPHAARAQALAEKRSVLRPVPLCPWWPFVWSQHTRVRVGDDGKVPTGSQRHPIDAPPRSAVIRCLRPDGDIYYLRHAPNLKAKPIVLLHVPVF